MTEQLDVFKEFRPMIGEPIKGKPLDSITDIGLLKSMIIELYQIIDDIDTISDVAKFDNVLYRKLVEMKQKERYQIGIQSDGYDLFYDK